MGVEVIGIVATSSLDKYPDFSIGFYIRSLFYKILKFSNPTLASRIHEYRGLAPFSASPLIRLEKNIYYFRFTSFDSRISEALLDFFKKFDEVELLNSRFYLNEVVYKNLDLKKLLSESYPYQRYELEFLSPTCFRRPCPYIPLYALGPIASILRIFNKPRSSYRYYPLPDPVLMFRNLARLWREYGGVTIHSKRFSRWLEEGGVAISGVEDIKTHRLIHRRRRAFVVGFTGKIRLSLPNDTFNEKYARIVYALLRLGEEVQIGVNRTAGFGLYKILKTAL
ncbi:MAG: CRISPR system precrRNA processing endoribonuclease RAMP protein Cas6 [Nitrososphaeria archaeon]|nr:CRISPR system precrRNA processing endoribonuclease RAMP protein Cas6 [Nitrososphaeria archaeon]